MQQAHLQSTLSSARCRQAHHSLCSKPALVRGLSARTDRRLYAKSRREMLTTEDPQGLSDEIARLQRENQLMQQLLARQSQTAEDQSEKVPGQASAEEDDGASAADVAASSTRAGTAASDNGQAEDVTAAVSAGPSAASPLPNLAEPVSPTVKAPADDTQQLAASPHGVQSKEASISRRQAGEPESQSVAPKQREGQARSPELLESTDWAQPEGPSALPTTEDEAISQQFEQAKADMAKRKRRHVPPQAEQPMDIVFVSAEAAPWSKTGGLGDVVGSLPIALADRGHRVMVVVPRYQNGKEDHKYAAAKKLDTRVGLRMGSTGYHEVDYYHQHDNQVDWVFVDHPVYHRAGNPYADEHGAFGDNVFRYSLLSMAACEAPLQLAIGGFRTGQAPGYPYGQRCLFLANDWHAALVPAYLAGNFRRHGVYQDARCILAIHNMAHQGVEPAHTFSSLGLPDDWFDTLGWEFPSWSATPGPAFNILKGGILAADRVLTVSEGYAWEMTTAEGGWGLDGILKNKQHVLNGVVNGIDMLEWDPSADEHTAASYSVDDLSGKAKCKAALQKELGLKVDPKVPLLGYIGRLDWQKGPDCALDAVQGLAQRGCQTIMLGSGVPEYEQRMRQSEQSFPDSFRGWVGFSIPVAHRIIAGCDIILMPSRFEPCGLNQLFAMRYGTIPVAHATGGLRDTIDDVNPFASDGEASGTGWTFTPPDAPTMLGAVDAALDVFHNRRDVWERVMQAGMSKDVSWERSAEQYEQIFNWAFIDNPIRYH